LSLRGEGDLCNQKIAGNANEINKCGRGFVKNHAGIAGIQPTYGI